MTAGAIQASASAALSKWTAPTGSQPFFIQYLSLILIILTIIAGTFHRPSGPPPAAAPAQKQFTAKVQDPEPQIEWISEAQDISAELEGPKRKISPELIFAWQQVLENHDVGLHIELESPLLDESILRYAHYIIHNIAIDGIPSAAVDVRVRSSNNGLGSLRISQRWFRWQK